jgi:hypothetical protein
MKEKMWWNKSAHIIAARKQERERERERERRGLGQIYPLMVHLK